MTIKRTLAMVLVVLCLAGAFSFSASAEEADSRVQDGFVYVRSTDLDTKEEIARIVRYVGTDQAVVTVPATIEGLPAVVAPSVFQEEHPEITRLVLAEGFRKVPEWNSAYLPNLQEVVLPQTLKVIGMQCFRYCPQLKTLTIPSGVALIAGMIPYNRIDDREAPFDPGITLRAEAGSYVERYAAYHELAFEPIVYEVSLGDLDADGLCTSTDARLVLQHTVGKATVDEAFADVDGDGKVTTTDARLCLQYAVGKAEFSLDVPANRPSGNLISPAAQVYVGYNHIEKKCVADRSGAIRAMNGILGNSYRMADFFWLTPPPVEAYYYFEEPDGTTIRIRDMGSWEITAYGERFFYFDGTREDWVAFLAAIG